MGNWLVMPYGFTILNCVQENPVESCFMWIKHNLNLAVLCI